jgi:hypothetical protein
VAADAVARVLAALAWSGVTAARGRRADVRLHVRADDDHAAGDRGALTPFPAIGGSASSLLSFVPVRDRVERGARVGLTFDGTCVRWRRPSRCRAILALAAFRLRRAAARRAVGGY